MNLFSDYNLVFDENAVYYALMIVNDWWISSCDNNLVFDENAGILCVNECVTIDESLSCDTNLVFDENAGILCVNECVNDWWISSCDTI